MCAISRIGYLYQVSFFCDNYKATSALLLSGSTVQVGWTPSHTGIIGNGLAGAVPELAAEGTPGHLDDFPWSYSHLRTQIRSQLLWEWQT